MPISFSIPQASGVAATYHVVDFVQRADFVSATAQARVSSYLSQAAYAAKDSPLTQNWIDVSPILAAPAAAPPAGATVQQAIAGMLELYLLTTPTFIGGTQVA